MKKSITAAILIILLLGGCGANERETIPAVRNVEATVPENNGINVRGMIESVESRNIFSMLGFTVDEVLVKVGDTVTEGQVLAILDTADLVLTIAQHKADLELARQNSQLALQDSTRTLRESRANLSNNVNMNVISAEAALSEAEIGLNAAQRHLAEIMRDYEEKDSPIGEIGVAVRAARVEFERMEASHANIEILFESGVVSREELRQSEDALNDIRLYYENTKEFQRRAIEEAEIMLQNAQIFYDHAQTMFNAAHAADQQMSDMLRGYVSAAEIAVQAAEIDANLESFEIAIQILERQLEESTIRSPIDGTVTAIHTAEGSIAHGLMFVVEDTENLRVLTSFREYDIPHLREGMEATIKSNAGGEIHGRSSPHSPCRNRIFTRSGIFSGSACNFGH